MERSEMGEDAERGAGVHVWGCWEGTFQSARRHDDPVHAVTLTVDLRAPSGARHRVAAFWDGEQTWRARFRPGEAGTWSFETHAEPRDEGLDGRRGTFVCTPYAGDNPLYRHGEVRCAPDGHHLMHADGTPFFYLADTCWLGPMVSTPDEWELYLRNRASYRFNAVQFLSTPFRSIAQNAEGRVAYTGTEHISIDPLFFRRLDARVAAMNAHGLLAVPLVIHAGKDTPLNPGHGLPRDQVIVLARYIVARYGGHHVLWDLIAEANFHGEGAEYWKEVGRAVFPEPPYPPLTLHPYGRDWVLDEFNDEPWLTVMGYQSAHGDDEGHWRWLTEGPPATDWRREPARPIINLEPPYEGHLARHSRTPFTDATVRRATYWSVFAPPPAGVAYGAHGIWSWSDGTEAPMAHKDTGVPLPWRQALDMPGATSMRRLAELMDSLPWWTLRPSPDLLAHQPGQADARRTVVATRSDDGTLALIYIPAEESVSLRLDGLAQPIGASWYDPRTGERLPADSPRGPGDWTVRTPGSGDWVLLLEGGRP